MVFTRAFPHLKGTWPPLHLQVAVVSRMFPGAFPTRKVLDQLWLQKRLILHFIVAWVLWAWHRWPRPEARQGSPSGVHQGLSPPERYLATSASPSSLNLLLLQVLSIESNPLSSIKCPQFSYILYKMRVVNLVIHQYMILSPQISSEWIFFR